MNTYRNHYYENGKINYEIYRLNDEIHNENGPAIIFYNKNGNKESEDYWLYGINLSKNEYYEFINDWDNKDDLKNAIMINYRFIK